MLRSLSERRHRPLTPVMTLAAVARLSRRRLPVAVTQASPGGTRTAAWAHELVRLPSPASLHHLGRLLPRPLRQFGGALPPALLQSQRSVSSGGRNSSDLDPACISEEFVSLMKEVEEISGSLDLDLNMFKNGLVLVFGVALASIVSFPVQIRTMWSDEAELNPKMRKTHAESLKVMQKVNLERLRARELQKWFAEERGKK